MSSSESQLKLYAGMLNLRSLRERALILLTLLVLLTVGWDFLFLEPAFMKRRKVLGEIQRVNTEISQLRADGLIVRRQAKVDPDLESRQQIAQFQELIADFDRKLEDKLVDLLSPREMPGLLQNILKQQNGLRLIAMENLPPTPLLLQGEGERAVPGLYRHALSMEMEGSYLKLLVYLEKLEKMPQRVFWDILTIDSKKYPISRIRLQIHTLSLTEDWIGV